MMPTRTTEVLHRYQSQCHFVHHKSLQNALDRRPPGSESGN